MRNFIVILVIILLCGCSNQQQFKKEQRPDNENTSENNNIVHENDDNINSSRLNFNDPLLYAKNIPEVGDLYRARDIQYTGLAEPITKEYLCSTIWHSSDDEFQVGIFLVFYLDDEFRIGSLHNSEITGKYEIIDDTKVKLYDYVYNESDVSIIDSIFSKEEWVLDLRVNHNNFWYSDCLYGNNQDLFFGASGSEPPAGEAYTINGFKIVKEQEWEAVTIDRVMFRTEPHWKADTKKICVVYQYDIPFESNINLEYLLKGATFTVIGRSEDKSIINGDENYWYYIRYYDFEYPTFGWVFGEYVKAYDDNKHEEYLEQYMNEINELK